MKHRLLSYSLIITALGLTNAGCSDETVQSETLVCDSEFTLCAGLCCSGICCDGICVQTDSDPAHCGSCDTQCSGSQICSSGTCAETGCDASQTSCSGQCVSLKADPTHCGDCSTVCRAGETCLEGICTAECAPGYTMTTGGLCVDESRDSEHCGPEHVQCPANTFCEEGSCQCQPGYFDCDKDLANGCESQSCSTTPELDENGCNASQKYCDGACADVISDGNNCGECGTVCTETQLCVKGSCIEAPVTTCEAPAQNCYGTCIDLQTDDDNCGQCLNKCPTGTHCESGTCELDCGSLTPCAGACIDMTISSSNCGECGKSCLTGQSCVAGACQCDASHFDCDGNPDNGCESDGECLCQPNDTRLCWNGSEASITRDESGQITGAKGICKPGTQTCDPSGRFWGPCADAVYPSALTCDEYGNLNGRDNDCDGEIDTVCRSECDLEAGEMSYIGCEYWGAYLDNLITSSVSNFTFVFSNPGDVESTIYIFDHTQSEDSSAQPLKTLILKPHQVLVEEISSQAKNMSKGSGIYNNAYRIRATHPITAYQFSPFGSANAHSNDASLLLPANVLGKQYIGMTWHSDNGEDHRSYLTVIATQPGETSITIKTAANISASNGTVLDSTGNQSTQTAIEAIAKGDTTNFKLKRFDVLTLMAPPVTAENQTGTTITADKNIAVFGASRASYVPSRSEASCCRDHIEEQLFPTQAWGKAYYAARAYSTGTAGDFWVITAREDDTTIKLTEGLKDKAGNDIGGTFTLNAGETRQAFETRSNFEIHADKPISVGQFLPSQQYNGLTIGDPSFILTVPYEQYRSSYDFVVSNAFDVDYLTIVAPDDAEFTLDGQKLDPATFIEHNQIGTTNFYVSYIKISPAVHNMTATKPFGLYSYGYFNMSSYGYPIGLDLKILNTN